MPSQATIDAEDLGRTIVETRHDEYTEFHLVWRWLQDSLEGGERYRDADYGYDPYLATWQWQDQDTGKTLYGQRTYQITRHNLVRHPQEYPHPTGPGDSAGDIEGAASTASEYAFRKALTPVPNFVGEAIGQHLARIYAREVRREAPDGPLGDALRAWWADVDGSGMGIDPWMQESVAPLFSVLGQLDLAFDRPPRPAGENVANKADELRLGLNRVVASYILPENLTNWSLDRQKQYATATVREWIDANTAVYRHWTATESQLYDVEGKPKGEAIEHRYGRPPIVRAFDVRKARCCNVGQSRYGTSAELQRSYYNVDSELTLTNSIAAHAVLSGPEDYTRGTAIKVGPSNVLPKKTAPGGGSTIGWEYVVAPSDASDRLSRKLEAIRDAADRAACLTKPAGAAGTGGQTVSQSGISKMLDQSTGNDLLSKLAKALERLERQAVQMVLTVAFNGPPTPEQLASVTIAYPTRFDLFTAADFAALIAEFQGLTGAVDGDLPETTEHMLCTFVRLAMPGLDDATYELIDAEIDQFVTKKATEAGQRAEANMAMAASLLKQPPPDPNAEPSEPLPVDEEEPTA